MKKATNLSLMLIPTTIMLIIVTSSSLAVIKTEDKPNEWIIDADAYTAAVSKESANITSLTFKSPSPFTLESAAGILKFYVAFPDENPQWSADLDLRRRGNLSQDGDTAILDCYVSSRNERLAKLAYLHVAYKFSKDMLEVATDFSFKYGLDMRTEVGIGLAPPQRNWDRSYVSCLNAWAAVRKPSSHVVYTCNKTLGDRTEGAERSWEYVHPALVYPWIVFEGNDRLVMLGDRDIASFYRIATSHRGYAAAFLRTPAYVKPGDVISYRLFLKPFPKPENSPTDVESWYLQNCFSSEPLTADLVPMPPDWPSRVVGYGNVRSALPSGPDEDWKPYFDFCARAYQKHFWWFSGHKTWYDMHPKSGVWTDEFRYQWREEDLRRLLKLAHDKGDKAYLYNRQFYFPDAPPFPDRPDTKEWAIQDTRGMSVWYGKPEWGVGIADFCDPNYLEWYIRDVENELDFWNADGVAWDMAWDSGGSLCARHPEVGGIQHGETRAIAEIYRWMRKERPNMRAIGNVSGGGGNPTFLYVDAVMNEGGWGGEEPNSDKLAIMWLYAQRMRAYRVNLFDLMYHGRIEGYLQSMGMGLCWADNGHAARTAGNSGSSDGAYYLSKPGKEDPLIIKLITGPFSEFSAQAMGTPIVWQTHGVETNPCPMDVFTTVWASPERLLIAAWNNTDKDQKVKISLDKEILARYGVSQAPKLALRVVNPTDCEVRETKTMTQQEPYLIQGTLAAKSLLLAEGRTR